ncbi:hypothetical protein G647_05038 [Cladophialophora carrionii CBS 160.54]|uniref:Uncharacterized protein n=1 Tax=Cladophialophora carrionii CBS 160.54 TaxID=1279043 RepID=V9D8R3_9EURO|nr:uncharacterized protein G647_05038 [Cladophialophora carrionii CBS 160.54]ETI23240.1 hypothetical protein G647_05038 [Cladophialophora carrionii CBS 160.54]
MAALSPILAKDSVFESSDPIVSKCCIGGLLSLTFATQRAHARAREKRQTPNEYLLQEVRNSQTQATPAPAEGIRELDERVLRCVQSLNST